ncbi:MAG: membrane protein insertion efficiency factor YidD [Syntrophales bacterium]|nr:membrane protein insertion efficiency factor YidD [Syntrophales bacterium]
MFEKIFLKCINKILILLIRGYQLFFSPLLGPCCRFSPSCSEYMVEAITKYGSFKGMWLGFKRITRCHPWSAGGYDPLP